MAETTRVIFPTRPSDMNAAFTPNDPQAGARQRAARHRGGHDGHKPTVEGGSPVNQTAFLRPHQNRFHAHRHFVLFGIGWACGIEEASEPVG